LLSSHLLTEVEQLCNRIAVLHQGEKVFDGTIQQIKGNRQRVALRTSDFARATAFLLERGLIASARPPEDIQLKDGVGIPDVARTLVEGGFAVEGIWAHEQTLEDFYLELIKAPPANGVRTN
jgi:ABC-type multidrug transport system ATPase subunit